MTVDDLALPAGGPLPAVDAAAWTSRRSRAVHSSAIRDLLAITRQPSVISLAGGLPDPAAIPTDWLDDCLRRAVQETGGLQYSTTEGEPGLRAAIAAWETDWCGRPFHPDGVLVTAGAQQALDLLGRTLLDPGDLVVVEDPGYVGALQAFQLAGADLLAVGQDGDGLDTEALAALLAGGIRPRLVYTTATFHNPAGTTLPTDRRRALAGLAERYGFVVVEDDAYRRLPFDGPPPAPIGTYSARVIRVGTFSKILSPGLRVGWLAGDPAVVAALTRVKQATDLHTSTPAQRAVLHAITDGARLAAHVAGIRSLYRARAGRLVEALSTAFGGALRVNRPAGGMFCWAAFTDGTATTPLLAAALDEGVAFVPGTAFGAGHRHAMRLCFATADPETITEGVRRLAAAHARTPPTTG